MDKHKSVCPNCRQTYNLKTLSPKNANLPLFLQCGHTMCEKCVLTIIKCKEPLECSVCQTVTNTSLLNIKEDVGQIYEHFPVNFNILGEIAFGVMKKPVNMDSNEEDHYIDLKEIISNLDCPKGQCIECQGPSSKICKQCEKILCENCFTKTHHKFIVFKDHVLQNLESQTKSENCETHTDKILNYYCFTCSKLICMDCLMPSRATKFCKNHDSAPLQEVQDQFMEELTEIIPKVDEMYRRLTKTAVDVGNLLYKNSCEDTSSEFSKIIEHIDQSFSKLTASIQKHRNEVISNINKIENTRKESLIVAKNELQEYITKAKKYLNKITNCQKLCLPALCIEGKKIIDGPWYLQSEESSDEQLKATINTELCTLNSNYVQLEGNVAHTFRLVTTAELPPDSIPLPPSAPVYPPELPKDVRQKKPPAEKSAPKPFTFCKDVPHYRSKNGSQSSLSSGRTETSSTPVYASSAPKAETGSNKKSVQQVGPMSNDETFQLEEGTQELVYISHIVNPHNFFVQKSSHQGLVKMLLREFGSSKEPNVATRPSINHIAPGKSYMMFQKADNVWQRCRVLSVEGEDFKVFCYDFGSIETISINELRLLPPKFAHSPPPLAFKCRLVNCEPISGAWTNDDAILIQQIINNKQAVMNVRRILPSNEFGTTLECDLTAYEDGTSLAHALAFHDRARMPQRIKYPDIVTRREKCKIFINNNDYKLKTKEKVFITYVVNPDKFFVRRSYLQNVYKKLCEDLEKEYGKSKSKIYLPEVGMPCVAQLKGAEGERALRWERCVVRELPGRQRVRLFLPDCGDEVLLHYSCLRHITEPFTRLSALANECHLSGITPVNKKWHPGSVTLLQQFQDRELDLVVEEEGRRGSIGVALSTDDDPTPVCLNHLMVEHKFAVTFGLFNFKRDFENQVITKKSPLDTPKPQPRNPNQIQILQKPAVPSPKAEDDELDAKDKGPYKLEVKLLNYQSPSLIYVSMMCQHKVFCELSENMQKYYSKQRCEEKTQWKVGDRCCALCVDSGTWRRAVILQIDGEEAKVFYTDFACTELLQTSALRVLPEQFAGLGDAAIKCHISGVIPAGGDDWPSITKEYLKDMLDAYQRLFITKVGEFKDKSMPVQLWVYHTTEGGALEPNISEWRCLNWRIIDQGLGMPDKSSEVAAELTKKEATGEDTLSFLNIKGSVSDWLQLEPVAELVSAQPSAPTDESTASKMIFVSDWLPPEPISSSEVNIMPTYIDNKGIIYFHQITQQTTLEVIRNTLNMYFGRPDPKAKFQKWTVGEPCIAMYYLDNRFYRGTVMAVDYEAFSCSIYYIDYGNEEVCSFENLRKSIALHELPSQAHKCMLDRIRPPSGIWETSTLDYVHKMIVEKSCLLKVRSETINDVMMVDLWFDKLCINDHLVEFDLAVYTDGSQAIKRKFLKSCDAEPCASGDSEPDYYLEDEDTSLLRESTIGPNDNWVKMMEDEDDGQVESFFTYTDNKDDEFMCDVASIHGVDWIELAIVDPDEDPAYQQLFQEIQAEATSNPPLDGVYQNKGCIALLPDDGKWYRVSILQYSQEKRKAKVRFVDYGDLRVLPETELREAREEWAEVEGAARRVTLHGVAIQCPASDREGQTAILRKLYDTLVEKSPLRATVVDYTEEGIPRVELTDAMGQLAYQSLIDDNLYVKSEPAEPTDPK